VAVVTHLKSREIIMNYFSRSYLKNSGEKIFGLMHLPPEQLMYRVVPHFLGEIAKKYFRLEIEGIENIPRRGPALITPNHSGYAGIDAFLLAHEISKATHRVPRVLAHHLWFLTKATSIPAEKSGLIEATMENGLQALKKNNLVALFPEGEYGNFKPSSKRYQLQEFKRGFVRLALMRQCPIVPTIILGAEETHINLASLKFTKYLRGVVLPLPLNVIPLPAKWKIIFLEPILLPYNAEAANDRELVREISQDIRERMQFAISEELKKRGSIFLPHKAGHL
jgi:1-acyl-sn-glycerol-3-phosphate acyltransferase